MVEGDPAVALRDVALPAEAKVAIVSSSPEAVRRLKRSGRNRFGPIRKIVAEEEAVAPAPRVDPEAFRPDARAGGSRGHSDRPGGSVGGRGAYDLGQVRTLLRGISRQAVDCSA